MPACCPRPRDDHHVRWNPGSCNRPAARLLIGVANMNSIMRLPGPCMIHHRARVVCLVTLGLLLPARLPGHGAGIPKPSDAPRPLPPAEAQKAFRVAPGFRVELVASEPLINEPTGVCWDERGRLHVCELHGYNLEGQLEIE